MRDAFGGIFNLATLVVFFLLVMGFLFFNIAYTKAFRVKNKIITSVEQFEGNCSVGSSCDIQIVNYIKELGYSVPSDDYCSEGFTYQNGYCLKRVDVLDNCGHETLEDRFYYEVETAININIPIINKILPQLKIFHVSGTTRIIDVS